MKKILLSVLLSNFTSAGFGFLINVILARFLDIAHFGKINLIFTIVVMMFTIADFGICNSVVIFYNRNKAKIPIDPTHYFNSLFIKYLYIILIVAFPITLLLKKIFIFSITETTVLFAVFYLFLIFRYLNAINQAKGKWLKYNLLNIFNNLCKIICFAIFTVILYFGLHYLSKYNSILVGYIAYAVILLITSLIVNRNYLSVSHEKIDKKFIKELKSIIIPLGLANIFIIITMRFGNLIIAKVLGDVELGIYSAANNLALVFPLITTSLMNVLLREASGKSPDFLAKILQNQKKYIVALFITLLLSVFLSKYFILFIFGSSYIDAINIFRILLIAYIGGVFFTPLESYYYGNHQNKILFIRFIQMMFVIIGSIIAIGYFGLYGIAIIVVLSRIIGWIYIYLVSHKILKRI